MLSALHGLAAPAVAQNQGIGGVSQAFGDRFDDDGVSPRYRIEVLAFAHNGFDPGEEIFPDEPFEIWLDARPPTFLTLPAPRPPGVFAPLVSPGADQPESGEPGDAALAAATPQPPGSATDPAGNSTGAPVDGPDGEPPPVPRGPLGPADDVALHLLLGSSTATNDAEIPGGEQLRMRSAFGQRLLASLQILEDPSAVPIVFAPIPEIPPLPGETDADEPEPVVEKPPPAFRMLRADELELRDALQRLQRGGGYTPLAHGGWVQPAYPPERAIPVDISLVGAVNPVGTVQLHLSRFLHVTVDLVYRTPPASPPSQAVVTVDGALSELKLPLRYALRTQRRVRSGEVHYLDHPAIGLLVVVRPQPVESGESDPLNAPRGPAA